MPRGGRRAAEVRYQNLVYRYKGTQYGWDSASGIRPVRTIT
jgi:hypothetical protein